ncbi:MAG: hypothetical protein NTV94_13250 [Planctomycetota bacterium]|nr:hypothetical protein [Planctomycetota bacterium]
MKSSHRFAIASLVALSTLTTAGYSQCTEGKLVPGDPVSQGGFGTSVAISGGFAVIGSFGADLPGAADCGAAYLFARNGLAWSQLGRFTAIDAAAGDSFGNAVAIDGDIAAIGSPNDDYSGFTDLGSVYIYARVNGVWTYQFNILAPVANRGSSNRFGSSLSLSGDTLAIGVEHEAGNRGAAYVFTRSGNTWALQARFLPAGIGATALFGCAVGASGDTVVVGSQGDDTVRGFATGSVYVFTRSGAAWSQQAKIVGTATTSSSQFGRELAISGNTLAVASPFEVAGGRTYTFNRVGPTWFTGQQLPLGRNVDLKGDQLIISGTQAAVDVVTTYSRSGSGAPFVAGRVLTASDGNTNISFGETIGVSEGNVIAGAASDDYSSLPNPGSAYTYSGFANAADTCGNALEASIGTVIGCTGGFASDGSSSCGTASPTPDAYYRFTAPCGGRYNFNTLGSNYDTILSVHSACPATPLNALACNDDAFGTFQSSVTVTLEAGQTVLARVADYPGATGTFQFSIVAAAPDNDTCRGATPIESDLVPFDLCYSSTEVAQVGTRTMANDIWFSFVPACSGVARFSTCPTQEPIDTMLALFEASTCNDLSAATEIASNDDSICDPVNNYKSTLASQVVAGHSYYVRVGGYPTPLAGYSNRGHGLLEVGIATGCPADFNADGGVDGADVNAFFGAWEAGDSSADVNCDGGVDGSDIDVFFPAWENGGC